MNKSEKPVRTTSENIESELTDHYHITRTYSPPAYLADWIPHYWILHYNNLGHWRSTHTYTQVTKYVATHLGGEGRVPLFPPRSASGGRRPPPAPPQRRRWWPPPCSAPCTAGRKGRSGPTRSGPARLPVRAGTPAWIWYFFIFKGVKFGFRTIENSTILQNSIGRVVDPH